MWLSGDSLVDGVSSTRLARELQTEQEELKGKDLPEALATTLYANGVYGKVCQSLRPKSLRYPHGVVRTAEAVADHQPCDRRLRDRLHPRRRRLRWSTPWPAFLDGRVGELTPPQGGRWWGKRESGLLEFSVEICRSQDNGSPALTTLRAFNSLIIPALSGNLNEWPCPSCLSVMSAAN